MTVLTKGPEPRYAKALYALAEEQQQVVAVAAAVESLNQAVASSAELAQFLASNMYSRAQKRQALENVLRTLKSPKLLHDTVCLMAEKGRADMLQGMLEHFARICDAAQGRAVVAVKTAAPLNAQQKADIEKFVKAQNSTAKEVVLQIEEDPSLIGGVVIQIGSDAFDASLKGRLEGLRRSLQVAM